MKRVFLVLLVCATVLAVFLAVAMHLEKRRLAETAGVFFGLLYEDAMDAESYKLTNTDQFLDFHAPESLRMEVAEWKRLLGEYRGVGEHRGTFELAPGRQRVVVELLFDNGTAEGGFVFQERKGAHAIDRFSFDLTADTELPPEPESALAAAYVVGEAVRAGNAPDVWRHMSYELRDKIGASREWYETFRSRIGDLVDPGDPEEIEPFAVDKDDPSLFKGIWKTKYENGTLWVRVTLRWVDVGWRLDDIEMKRID